MTSNTGLPTPSNPEHRDGDNLITDDGIRAELNAFYERAVAERSFPRERANALLTAFEIGLERDGRWPAVVLKDLGFEAVRAYRRVDQPKDLRNV